MDIRFAIGKNETKALDTNGLRDNFLVSELFQADKLKLTYSHYDRMIIGGVLPVKKAISLSNPSELRAEYFLERRELGIINIGGKGEVVVDGKKHGLKKLECLYVGKGAKKITFSSADKKDPAKYYLLSAPAHHAYPTKKFTKEQASPVALGDAATSNKRTVYKYIHRDGIQSCQLVMGLTVLEKVVYGILFLRIPIPAGWKSTCILTLMHRSAFSISWESRRKQGISSWQTMRQ